MARNVSGFQATFFAKLNAWSASFLGDMPRTRSRADSLKTYLGRESSCCILPYPFDARLDGFQMLSINMCLLTYPFFAAFIFAQKVPRPAHVWRITEENHSDENVVDYSQKLSYDQLIHQYGLAT